MPAALTRFPIFAAFNSEAMRRGVIDEECHEPNKLSNGRGVNGGWRGEGRKGIAEESSLLAEKSSFLSQP